MRFIFIILLTFLTCHTNTPAHGLELTEAIKYALEHSPQIYSVRLALKAQEQLKTRAFAEFLPKINLSTPIYSLTHSLTDFNVNNLSKNLPPNLVVHQNLLNFGASVTNLERSKKEILAETQKFFSIKNDLALQIVATYLQVLKAREVKKLREDNVEVMHKHLIMEEERLKVGESTKTQLFQVKAKTAAAEADLVKAIGEMSSATIAFIKLIGLAPNNINYPQYLPSIPTTLKESLNLAKLYNPGLKSLVFRKEASQKAEKTAFLRTLPSLDLVIRKQFTLTNPFHQLHDFNPVLQLEIPIFQGGLHLASIKEARYLAQKSVYDYYAGAKNLAEKITEYWHNCNSADSLLEASQALVSSYLSQKLAISKEEDLKLRPIIDVLDAEIDLQKAQITLIDAKINFITSIYSLLLTIGDLSQVVQY